MIPQYVAASLVSENKVLCHPASVDSIPTSAGQEDHVSMGNAAALKFWQVLANSERALAIELLAGGAGRRVPGAARAGAGDAGGTRSGPLALPDGSRGRPLAPDIELVADGDRSGGVVAAVEDEIGELA